LGEVFRTCWSASYGSPHRGSGTAASWPSAPVIDAPCGRPRRASDVQRADCTVSTAERRRGRTSVPGRVPTAHDARGHASGAMRRTSAASAAPGARDGRRRKSAGWFAVRWRTARDRPGAERTLRSRIGHRSAAATNWSQHHIPPCTIAPARQSAPGLSPRRRPPERDDGVGPCPCISIIALM
jgi:hypothetical protein